MALHSLEFIFIFLPVFLLLYYRLESIKLADTKILGFVKVGCTHTKKRSGRGYYYYQYYTYY